MWGTALGATWNKKPLSKHNRAVPEDREMFARCYGSFTHGGGSGDEDRGRREGDAYLPALM